MMQKEPPYDELIEVLRRDWQIEASWDGLRRFWYVGWTDEHVESCAECAKGLGAYADSLCDPLKAENAKLRERVDELEGLTDGKRYIPQEWYQLATNENAKLRELVRSLHMAYVGALNKCEGMDVGLIWEHCEMVDAELAKSHARFEAERHRFDVAMRELGIEVDE